MLETEHLFTGHLNRVILVTVGSVRVGRASNHDRLLEHITTAFRSISQTIQKIGMLLSPPIIPLS